MSGGTESGDVGLEHKQAKETKGGGLTGKSDLTRPPFTQFPTVQLPAPAQARMSFTTTTPSKSGSWKSRPPWW